MKKLILALLVMCMLLTLTACDTESSGHKFALVTMKDYGEFIVELYTDEAPITCQNFISLVEKKFYDGLTIHRFYQGLIIQGGDPEGTGYGGPGYTIKGEFAANGIENNISHTRGTISMARRGDSYDSAGSQFFIMLKDYPGWDGSYAAFGRVISGMEVVDAISAVPYDERSGKPSTTITIESIVMIEDPNESK